MNSNSKKVAELAGVSVATVSRVLSGKCPVRPETRHKVMSAIEICGYVPNESAKAIAHLAVSARRTKIACQSA